MRQTIQKSFPLEENVKRIFTLASQPFVHKERKQNLNCRNPVLFLLDVLAFEQAPPLAPISVFNTVIALSSVSSFTDALLCQQ